MIKYTVKQKCDSKRQTWEYLYYNSVIPTFISQSNRGSPGLFLWWLHYHIFINTYKGTIMHLAHMSNLTWSNGSIKTPPNIRPPLTGCVDIGVGPCIPMKQHVIRLCWCWSRTMYPDEAAYDQAGSWAANWKYQIHPTSNI